MRRILSALVAGLILSLSVGFSAASRPNITHEKLMPETLQYRVMFKWGLINKKAGSATLTLTHGPAGYESLLSAKSEPWADKVFCVRDTLIGRMTYGAMQPTYYEKIAHEGNEHKHDIVRYDYSDPNKVTADCTRKVYKKGVLQIDEKRSMESDGYALDMLTSFYFMRSLPFASWQPGHTEQYDIFSGKRKELLSIEYGGVRNVTINGAECPAYWITFKFTSGGGVKTSDDMEAWISADNRRVPLKMQGKLPVGMVHCTLEQ